MDHRNRVNLEVGTPVAHITDDDLERLIMGTVKDEGELAALEEHLLVCDECMARGAMLKALSRSQARAKRKGG